MTTQSTPYEQGKIDGQWTAGQVEEHGFEDARECLAHGEQVVEEEQATLRESSDEDYAQYVEGLAAGFTESLGALIDSGK